MLARRIAIIAVAIGSIIGLTAATTGAQAATARSAELGAQRLITVSNQPVIVYRLVNQAHVLCLDAVRSGDGSSGDLVQLFHCNGGNNQYWYGADTNGRSAELRNHAHGLCLDAIRQDDGSDGDFVQLYRCNGGANQRWYFRGPYPSGAYEIVNDAHGLCLDAARQADGRNYDYIQLWRCNAGSNQMWKID